MWLLDRFQPALDLTHRRRRVWTTAGRAHIELREIPSEEVDGFAAALVEALGALAGVTWSEVHARPGRLVVAHEARLDPAAVVAELEAVEAACGVDGHPLGRDRPDHPGDDEPVSRNLVALGADVAGLGLALVAGTRRFRLLPIGVDTAALGALAENVGVLRGALEQRVPAPVVELGLAVFNGLASGLAQGPLGPAVDIVDRVALLAEIDARRRAWDRREPDWCAAPSGPPVGRLRPRPRPAPLADGPVERYAARAWPVSLGGFGVDLALTGRLDQAAAPLLAGLPKAARLGREIFAAQVGRMLAERGMVVLDPAALRALDRLDRLVVDLPCDEPAAVAELVSVGREAGMAVWWVGEGAPPDGVTPDRVVPPGAVCDRVGEVQADGHGVLAVARGHAPVLEVADCGVGLLAGESTPAWGAAVVGGRSVEDAWTVLRAAAVARPLSEQSARIALAGAGLGGLVAFGGMVPFATRRVAAAVNLAAMVAMANGARTAAGLAGRSMPSVERPTDWHALPAEEVLARLGTDLRHGLPRGEVEARTVPPTVPVPTAVALARAVGDELVNPLTPVLAAGAALSLAVGSVVDAALVTSVVALNAAIGGVQRFRTDEAVAHLGRRDERMVSVVRAGERARIPSSALVTGDLVELQAGDVVPADCRVVRARSVQVDESALTGESDLVDKHPAPVAATLVAERRSMLYEGTAMAAGRATGVVVARGDDTEARRALRLAGDAPPTGVELRLASLTEAVIPLTIGAGVAILGAGLLRGRPLAETASAGISLAMAAAPEGLPLLASVAQLGAARRLSERGALVRNPRAIEALGRVDVLCADKTGTLTEGRAAVVGVAPDGTVEPIDELGESGRAALAVAARATPRSHAGRDLAHPTDRAVAEAAGRLDVSLDLGVEGWERVADLPFEPARGYHATLGRRKRGATTVGVLSVKGAPEVVLERCTHRRAGSRSVRLTAPQRTRLQQRLGELTGEGLRVLALAERTVAPEGAGPAGGGVDEALVAELRFVGFLALRDPVRPSTRPAIEGAAAAGVRVVMITGDHPSTAEGVARELGLIDGGAVLTGADIDGLDDDHLGQQLEAVSVCARVTPAHKVRIVRALQTRGHSVAMTGDGSNDAPAIRLADVGIALGSRATDAAREAADVVVTDDRIETIVDAVAEGRALWASVRDAVAILVGGNLGEVAFTVGGSLLAGSPPLNARQLLLVNLLTDIAPAMAIAVRPPDLSTVASVLREGPDRSLGEALDRAIRVRAASTALGAFGAWGAARLTGTPARASTVGLLALVGSQLGQTVVAGGTSPPVLVAGLGSAALLGFVVQTPGLSHLFGCRPLGPVGWGTALAASAAATAGSVVVPALLERRDPPVAWERG